MATVLNFIAWTIELLLSLLSAATAGVFFLVSPAFRRQSFERWGRAVAAPKRGAGAFLRHFVVTINPF